MNAMYSLRSHVISQLHQQASCLLHYIATTKASFLLGLQVREKENETEVSKKKAN